MPPGNALLRRCLGWSRQQEEKRARAAAFEEAEWVTQAEAAAHAQYEREWLEGHLSSSSSSGEDGEANLEHYCLACEKGFKSASQLANHERSKKHQEALRRLRALLREEDHLMAELGLAADPQLGSLAELEAEEAAEEAAERAAAGARHDKPKSKKDRRRERDLKRLGRQAPAVAASSGSSGEEDVAPTKAQETHSGPEEEEEEGELAVAPLVVRALCMTSKLLLVTVDEDAMLARLVGSMGVKSRPQEKRQPQAVPSAPSDNDEEEEDDDEEEEDAVLAAMLGKVNARPGGGGKGKPPPPPPGPSARKEEEEDDDWGLGSKTKSKKKPSGKSGAVAPAAAPSAPATLPNKKGKKGRKGDEDDASMCKVCRKAFPSRTKLFEHIRETGHAALK